MEGSVWDEWDTRGRWRAGFGMSGIPGVGGRTGYGMSGIPRQVEDRVWEEWDTRSRWRTGYGMGPE